MRYVLLICLFGIQMIYAQDENPKALFNKQVEQSCASGSEINKSVTDLSVSDGQTETKSYKLEGTNCMLEDELVHSFLYYYGENRIKAYYNITQRGDTLVAQLKDGEPSPLQLQKILFSADKKRILFVESIIKRSYWLYDTQSHIKIIFDPNGLYVSHELSTQTDVSMVGDGVYVRVSGKRK